MAKKSNIIRYKRPGNFNIGIIIFLIIIIYVFLNVFTYFTSSDVAKYLVQEGTIASNNIYQGIIIRDETVEYTPYSGHINYYVKNASKIAVNDIVYSIDTIGTISNEISSAGSTEDAISNETLTTLASEIDTFMKDYNPNQFSGTYTFVDNLNSEIAQNINTSALASLSDRVNQASSNNTFYQMKSNEDGIVVYEIDGYENYTIEDVTSNKISYNDYKSTSLFKKTEVTIADPVYKRINSENWNIIVPISADLAEELSEKSTVKIRFCKDDFTTNASSSIIREDDSYYLNLSLKTAMVRYVNDRFIDIELVMSEKTGLKIPQSSITTKEFFTIPKEFFTIGADSDDPGLMIKQGKGNSNTVTLVTPTLYYETEDYYYVDNENISAGDVVLMSDSSSSYIIGTDTASLIGVYNINKGYAVFKQINIIYENEEYAIVETKTAYGLSLYDHIALDASKVKENQLTTK